MQTSRDDSTDGTSTTDPKTIIRIENVSKIYRLGDQDVNALRKVTLDVKEGYFMAIAGTSGSGKSTLLNIMGCIDTPSEGRVFIEGKDVSGQTPDELANIRARTIGFIFQTFNLLPVLSAEENVEYPLLQMPEISKEERRARVNDYLKLVGLAKYAHHRPNQLSGGQRQRVAIARALVANPRILIFDEATSALDYESERAVMQNMQAICRGRTVLIIAHRLSTVRLANCIIAMDKGQIVEQGTHEELLAKEGGYYRYLYQLQNG